MAGDTEPMAKSEAKRCVRLSRKTFILVAY